MSKDVREIITKYEILLLEKDALIAVAADRIISLESEIERLRHDCDYAVSEQAESIRHLEYSIAIQADEIERLRNENEELAICLSVRDEHVAEILRES